MAAVPFFRDTNVAAVTSRENTQWTQISTKKEQKGRNTRDEGDTRHAGSMSFNLIPRFCRYLRSPRVEPWAPLGERVSRLSHRMVVWPALSGVCFSGKT